MKNKSLILGVTAVAVVAIVLGVVALSGKNTSSTKSTAKSGDSMGSMKTNSTSSDTQQPVAATKVTISNYAFSPATVKVKVGDTVTWTNQDDVGHTVTADNTSSDAPLSDLLSKGQSYSFTFKKAGTYTYYCQPHPYMKGTVIVE